MGSVTLMLAALLLWHFAADVDWESHRWVRTVIIGLTCIVAIAGMISLVRGY